MKQQRSATIFPNHLAALKRLGENIRLARKRRAYTQTLISERTGLSRVTIRRIENGDPHVSIGHYVIVLSMVDMVEDLARVAANDLLAN